MSETNQRLNVLLLCSLNFARSILAGVPLYGMGVGRFTAYSAFSSPRENRQRPNSLSQMMLQNVGISTAGLRGKSCDEFTVSEAQIGLMITLCDNAAGEFWPSGRATDHLGYADSSDVDAPEVPRLQAFQQSLHAMKRRLELLVRLPEEKFVQAVLQITARQLAANGET
ncbi:Low molecular weight phosphotyrosine protein phosphatase [compost metagenome]